ncbi:hypothetical protein [Halomarina rubra]|uniref:Uncharacterized protein n=1 Tax=Halomarina rubra TaxID=2071873 RepID=A0ABD6AVT9_9EURY|nr:hypothetical protein [Halomarina rubra]
MSTKTLRSDRTTAPSLPTRLARTTQQTVAAVAFWLAVALPFCYLPMLVAGLHTTTRLSAFGGLLALNALCLVVGHAHRDD